MNALAAVLALGLAGQEPAAAPAPPSPPPAPAVFRQELLVADSLPYVPASNTIVTKLPVALAWTPANVGVVNAVLFEEQDALVLGQALQNVSGLHVQTQSGLADHFVLRGFDSQSSGLVLTDGAPEPEVTFYQLYNAEQVEVLKGPAGFLYGSNPLAGAVNIVREQPVPADFAVLGLAAGSHETYEGTLDWNRAAAGGRAAFRLNGLWRQSDGWRDGRESSVVALNPAFSWRPREGTAIHVNLEELDSDFVPDAGLPVDAAAGRVYDLPRRRSYASPFDDSTQEVRRYQVDVEHRLSDRLALRNKTYYRELDWLSSGTQLQAFPLPPAFGGGTIVGRALVDLDDRQRFLGNNLEAIVLGRTGGVVHHLVAGLELQRQRDEFDLGLGALPALDLERPVETATARPPLFPLAKGDARSDVVAPYVIDQMVLTPRLQALVGARYDAIDFADRATGTERDHGELSPMLGAVWAPRPGLSFYASGSGAFAPPAPLVVGEREPEESRQVEVGARRELWGGRLRTTLAAYELRRENIAIPDATGVTRQTGDQRARGVELEAAADLGGGRRAFLAYAWSDSELTRFTELQGFGLPPTVFVLLDRSGNRSPFAPEHLASLWLSQRFGSGWGLAGGGRWVGEQTIAPDNQVGIDGYLLLDAALSYGAGDWRLSLHLKNLTDEEYETRGLGVGSVIPGAPRSATVGVEVRW